MVHVHLPKWWSIQQSKHLKVPERTVAAKKIILTSHWQTHPQRIKKPKNNTLWIYYFINFPNTGCEKRRSFCLCMLPPDNWEFSSFCLTTENFTTWHKRKETLTKLHSPIYSIIFLIKNIYSIFLSVSFWCLQTAGCTSFLWSKNGVSYTETISHTKITHIHESLWKQTPNFVVLYLTIQNQESTPETKCINLKVFTFRCSTNPPKFAHVPSVWTNPLKKE